MIEFILTKWHVLVAAAMLVTLSGSVFSVLEGHFTHQADVFEAAGIADAIELFYASEEVEYVYEVQTPGRLSIENLTVGFNSGKAQVNVPAGECEVEVNGRLVLRLVGDVVEVGV